MYERGLRNTVASIVLVGHLGVFCVGMALGIFKVLVGTDAIQILLMASPVLATTALAAVTYVMESGTSRRRGKKVTTIFAAMTIAIPTVLILGILALFYVFFTQVDGFGPTELKIALGGVETTFGAFLGLVAGRLFPHKRSNG